MARPNEWTITVDGQQYEKTGDTSCGKRVFCKLGDFERACKSFTNELLYVEVESGRLVPRDEFATPP